MDEITLTMDQLLAERAIAKDALDQIDGKIRAEAERLRAEGRDEADRRRAALRAADAVLVRHRAPKAEKPEDEQPDQTEEEEPAAPAKKKSKTRAEMGA